VLLAAFAVAADERDAFDLKVVRVRLLRDQPGNLHKNCQGVSFNQPMQDQFTIGMQELREANVATCVRFGLKPTRFQEKPVQRREYTFRTNP